MTLKFPIRNPAWSKNGAVRCISTTLDVDTTTPVVWGQPSPKVSTDNAINRLIRSAALSFDDDTLPIPTAVDTPAARNDDVEICGLGLPGVISTSALDMDTTPVVWGQPSPKVSTDNAINRLIRSAALSFDDDAVPIPATTIAFTTATATPRRCGSTLQTRLPPTAITMCNTMDTNITEYPNKEVVADYDPGKIYLDRTSTEETATMDSWSLQTASDCCHVGEEIQLADTLDSKEDTLESKDDNKVNTVTTTTVASPPVVCVCDESVVADYDQFYDQGKEILYLGRTPTRDTATIDSSSLQTTLLETTTLYKTTDLDRLTKTGAMVGRTQALEKVRVLLEREQKQEIDVVLELYNKVKILRSDIISERRTNEVLFEALHSSKNGNDDIPELHSNIRVLRQSLDRERMANKQLRKTVKELQLSNKENFILLSQLSEATIINNTTEIMVGNGEVVIGDEDVSSNDDVVELRKTVKDLTKKNEENIKLLRHLLKVIDMSKLVETVVESDIVEAEDRCEC